VKITEVVEHREEGYSMKQKVALSESPDVVVRQTIAELEGCQPSQLGTLSEVVDIDELNSLGSSPVESEKTTVSIKFEYCGYSIEFDSNRTLCILP